MAYYQPEEIRKAKEMDLYIMSELVNSLSYLLITPYFYNYYDLLKGGK